MKIQIVFSLPLLLSCSMAVAASPKAQPPIDPDDSYKKNCMRCHAALPEYSPRMNKTVMMHMRQAANLPGDEAEAILRYLNGTPLIPSKEVQPATSPQTK